MKLALKFLLKICVRQKAFQTMPKNLPIMLALCLMLSSPYSANMLKIIQADIGQFEARVQEQCTKVSS